MGAGTGDRRHEKSQHPAECAIAFVREKNGVAMRQFLHGKAVKVRRRKGDINQHNDERSSGSGNYLMISMHHVYPTATSGSTLYMRSTPARGVPLQFLRCVREKKMTRIPRFTHIHGLLPSLTISSLTSIAPGAAQL